MQYARFFIVTKKEIFSSISPGKWSVTNVGKKDDNSLYVLRGDGAESKECGCFLANADSFDGTHVTVEFYLSKDTINEYMELGVKPDTLEKVFPVVRGEYIRDASVLSSLSLVELHENALQSRLFFWYEPKNNGFEKNHLEFVRTWDWSSETNTTACSIDYYWNLIATDRGEIITEKSGTTLNKSMLFGSNDDFIAIDSYIETYQNRWMYGSELLINRPN